MTTFVSRAQAGLRAPRSLRRLTQTPAGVAVHYGGDGRHPTSHAGCIARWREWQAFHMGPARGWADIAYNFGFCDHDTVFAGRGWGVRSAAQGTNDGNARYLAACWVGGSGSTPGPGAVAALASIVADVRSKGAGLDVHPHRHFHPTACCGDPLARAAASMHRKPVGVLAPPPPTPPVTSWEDDLMASIHDKITPDPIGGDHQVSVVDLLRHSAVKSQHAADIAAANGVLLERIAVATEALAVSLAPQQSAIDGTVHPLSTFVVQTARRAHETLELVKAQGRDR